MAMEIDERILCTAEDAFQRHGFAATGMDRLSSAAEVSSRTLYKHVGSKDALIVAVLNQRCGRFLARLDVRSVDDLFQALEDWTNTEGARGCFFLRAESEMGREMPGVVQAVASYRKDLYALVGKVVADDVGQAGQEDLVDKILVLFEGATSAASYRGANAVGAARSVAALLMRQARTATPAPRD